MKSSLSSCLIQGSHILDLPYKELLSNIHLNYKTLVPENELYKQRWSGWLCLITQYSWEPSSLAFSQLLLLFYGAR